MDCSWKHLIFILLLATLVPADPSIPTGFKVPKIVPVNNSSTPPPSYGVWSSTLETWPAPDYKPSTHHDFFPPIPPTRRSRPSPKIRRDQYQEWKVNYPGPIHSSDWNKYLEIWDPNWWNAHLDSIRQTSCTCSSADYDSHQHGQEAALMEFQYYNHELQHAYALNWVCGPTPSQVGKVHDKYGALSGYEHCWNLALGDSMNGFRGVGKHVEKSVWCVKSAGGEQLCVQPWRERHRWFKFRGHKRNYDREGVHSWAEDSTVVAERCAVLCKEKFGMEYDDSGHHDPAFIDTWFPPKPVVTWNGAPLLEGEQVLPAA